MTKPIPNTKFKAWLEAATPYMKKQLASMAKTSEAMFRQWAEGRRQCSAEKAGLIEEATAKIALTSSAPRPLSRADMCQACAKCSYFLDAQNDVDDLK